MSTGSLPTPESRSSSSSPGRDASIAFPSAVTTAGMRRPMSLARRTGWLPS
ncbi:hypothetical protein [Lentzea aerocolonigenes]|uniref:hypothetical protein n=1 Tax=Lentzea aerocolonigenes TaxID=68170 RepID=UPI0020A4F3EE|nr:hypothetical protein [Lentzea aerocolonigenes]